MPLLPPFHCAGSKRVGSWAKLGGSGQLAQRLPMFVPALAFLTTPSCLRITAADLIHLDPLSLCPPFVLCMAWFPTQPMSSLHHLALAPGAGGKRCNVPASLIVVSLVCFVIIIIIIVVRIVIIVVVALPFRMGIICITPMQHHSAARSPALLLCLHSSSKLLACGIAEGGDVRITQVQPRQ